MIARARRHVTLAVASATFTLAPAAAAYCPSYGTQAGCAVEPSLGKNPDSDALRTFIERIGAGAFDTTQGVSLVPLTSGCDSPSPEAKVPARFPCHLLFALAQQESDWKQFCVPESPASAVGEPERTIVSFDCGYGVSQVTSGMRQKDDPPDYDRGRVASDVLYNLSVGADILRAKWEVVNCVGDRKPEIIEHWYSALWAYNGLAYVNNPNNPNLTAGRGVYDPANGGSYTYQERVLGWMEHPKAGRWTALAPAYPDRAEIGTTGIPRVLTDPDCASPTSCTKKRTTHTSECKPPAPPPDAGPPPPEPDAATEDADIQTVTAAVRGEADSGCDCSVSSRAAPRRAWLAVGLVAAFWWRRVRSTSSSRALRRSARR